MDYNARYYSPVLGRFVSPDTIVPEPGSSGGFNRYRYTRNNPLKYTDPSGHCEKDAAGNYVNQECVEIAQKIADETSASLDEILSYDFKYGDNPYLEGGDDRINYQPYIVNNRFVMVDDKWVFDINYLSSSDKDVSYHKLILANYDDISFFV